MASVAAADERIAAAEARAAAAEFKLEQLTAELEQVRKEVLHSTTSARDDVEPRHISKSKSYIVGRRL